MHKDNLYGTKDRRFSFQRDKPKSILFKEIVKKAKTALSLPFVRPFDITGRPMKGWIMIEDKGFKTDKELEALLNQARAFVKTLPSK